jgi:hypothetical protein
MRSSDLMRPMGQTAKVTPVGADARIAALKAGLQLTPDQAKNWPAFEQALREMAQLRIERRQARQAAAQQGQTPPAPATTPFDRLAKRADNLSKVGTALKHIADAGGPLYQSLTDAQKRRFHVLARILRPHHHHTFARNDGPGRDWHHGQGFGPNGQGRGWQGFGPRRFGMEDNAPDAAAQNLTENQDQGNAPDAAAQNLTESQDQGSDL